MHFSSAKYLMKDLCLICYNFKYCQEKYFCVTEIIFAINRFQTIQSLNLSKRFWKKNLFCIFQKLPLFIEWLSCKFTLFLEWPLYKFTDKFEKSFFSTKILQTSEKRREVWFLAFPERITHSSNFKLHFWKKFWKKIILLFLKKIPLIYWMTLVHQHIPSKILH